MICVSSGPRLGTRAGGWRKFKFNVNKNENENKNASRGTCEGGAKPVAFLFSFFVLIYVDVEFEFSESMFARFFSDFTIHD